MLKSNITSIFFDANIFITLVANEAGAQIVAGKSLKAALDLDWDNPESRTHALRMVID